VTTPNPAAPKPVAGIERNEWLKRLKKLCSKFNPLPFSHICSLEDSKVEVVDAGSHQNWIDARFCSRTEVGRGGEAVGVEHCAMWPPPAFRSHPGTTSGECLR
jgi:hypothetical protein